MSRYALLLLLAAGWCNPPLAWADAPPMPSPSAIRLPEQTPTPPAPNPPAPVTRLTRGQLYVVTSPTEILLVASRDGMVSVKRRAAPLVLSGDFVDGGDDDREYKTGFVYVVKAASVGQVELIITPDLTGKNLIRRVLDVDNGGPTPPGPKPPVPPGPEPPVPPIPPPTPAPIAGDGLHVLMIEESADRSKLTTGQINTMFGKAVRTYLDAHCPLGPDGKLHEWRIYDTDTVMNEESKLWQDAMKRRPEKPKLPWIIVSNPQHGGGWEGPLPATVDETLKLLKQYGGD